MHQPKSFHQKLGVRLIALGALVGIGVVLAFALLGGPDDCDRPIQSEDWQRAPVHGKSGSRHELATQLLQCEKLEGMTIPELEGVLGPAGRPEVGRDRRLIHVDYLVGSDGTSWQFEAEYLIIELNRKSERIVGVKLSET